jgi:transcriptional regulator with GAF, ATPase, and Fis domain
MMTKKIQISVYFLVPFIFSMFSLFSFVVAFQMTDYFHEHPLSPAWLLIVAGIAIPSLAALIGYYIIRMVLEPAETFIEKVRESPVLQGNTSEAEADTGGSDQMEAYSRIFSQVAQALNIMDADALFPEIVGRSRPMREVLSQVIKVAPTDSTVLLLGESGTGKELIADSIVKHSSRKDKPFIKINCAAISPGLMESELFGHEKGAFTGAVSLKKGCFEQAHGGTIFLDEIGDMPLDLQVKVLRVLQEKEFCRVGGTRSIRVDVRIIAATNKNLEKLISKGDFREDLFYRINVFPIRLPPLRERKNDIVALVTHFLKGADTIRRISSNALEIFETYDWPGNIRELQNVVERASVLAGEQTEIRGEHLSDTIKSGQNRMMPSHCIPADVSQKKISLDETIKAIEKSLICSALKKNRGVQVRAAEELGINQRSLWNRIKKFEIDVSGFKEREVRNGSSLSGDGST